MTNIEKYGFTPVRSRELSEIGATLYEFSHEKSGATVIYLDREDENKTFAIGFATPPEDDTGVFHIIEHSVLCGSKKYPLNDPFAELLKGSLNTFLNAITFEDRTIYPVSSRCERDFLNLVDVYMDAVLAPNMLKNPSIFMQEGWHYEYDSEADKLSYNGVVYNEMKGAYSSPDELAAEALNQALFSGSAYCYESGGNPTEIPNLTYEKFKETHAKYYHPSNARIFLDGKIDLDKILPLINSHLCDYDKSEKLNLSGRSEPRIAPTVEIKYEISESEDEHGKARVLYGFVFSDYSDQEAHLVSSILCDILCGSNASPLKKALLDRGLAKDVAMYSVKSRETTLVIEIRDADEERLDEIDGVVNDIITSTSRTGIEKNKILSSLNSIEFRLRERDYGTLPTGIVFAITMYGSWMYSNTPEDGLLLNDTVESVRERIDSDYFEKALLEMTVKNDHRAKIIMLPDKTLGERTAKEEADKLNTLRAAMSKEDLKKICDEEEALRLWQQTEPGEEELASLPKLSLSDIPEKSNRPTAYVSEHAGVKVLSCPVQTNGIIYLSLLLDASDLAGEELTLLSILSSALLNFPTENFDALSLQNDIKANLGSLFASFAVGNKDGIATPYLKIGAKALESKTDDIIRLVRELLTSKIENSVEMGNILAQAKTHMEDMIISSGEAVALSRAQASRSEAGSISEHLSGYEAYRFINEVQKDSERVAQITKCSAELLRRLTSKNRLTISLAGKVDDKFISELISIFPADGNAPIKKTTPICATKSEYFLLPSKVAYAVAGGSSEKVSKNLGILRVARSILSYEYLWNTVRVQSGAYGTGFVPRKDGDLAFYSYRDPSPAKSLEFYKESADYLRSLANDNIDITKFIIGAIGEFDPLITPRTAISIATGDYLNEWSAEDEATVRADMLSMSTSDLLAVAEIIDEVLSDESVIIVGGQEHLDMLDTAPERIIKL